MRLSRLLFLLGFCWFISVSLNFFLDTRKVVGKVVRVKIVQCLSGFCLLTSTKREGGKWAIEKAESFYENFSSFSWKCSPIDGERDKREHFELFDVTWENIYMQDCSCGYFTCLFQETFEAIRTSISYRTLSATFLDCPTVDPCRLLLSDRLFKTKQKSPFRCTLNET